MSKKKKYQPIKIPRKNARGTPDWFPMIHALNKYSIDCAKDWQEEGQRSVSGWAVMNPKGNLLPSSFSVRRSTAMKRCLEPALQRFNGLVSDLFGDWENKGYKLVKIKWVGE